MLDLLKLGPFNDIDCRTGSVGIICGYSCLINYFPLMYRKCFVACLFLTPLRNLVLIISSGMQPKPHQSPRHTYTSGAVSFMLEYDSKFNLI